VDGRSLPTIRSRPRSAVKRPGAPGPRPELKMRTRQAVAARDSRRRNSPFGRRIEPSAHDGGRRLPRSRCSPETRSGLEELLPGTLSEPDPFSAATQKRNEPTKGRRPVVAESLGRAPTPRFRNEHQSEESVEAHRRFDQGQDSSTRRMASGSRRQARSRPLVVRHQMAERRSSRSRRETCLRVTISWEGEGYASFTTHRIRRPRCPRMIRACRDPSLCAA
jgi:hypothetical protein